MILSRRAQPNPLAPSHVSGPINSELAPSLSSPLASPPLTPPRAHKRSLSKQMTWLNRGHSSTSSHSSAQAAPKPIRISEPKVGSSLDQFTFHRSGRLGSGAIVVRTPQEALFGSPRVFEPTSAEQGVPEPGDISALHNHAEENEGSLLPPPPPSPPLPLLPDASDAPEGGGSSLNTTSTPVPLPSDHVSHFRSSASPPLPKTHVSSSSSQLTTMQTHSGAPSCPIPSSPASSVVIPPQPPFEAILLSPVPDGPVDSSKLIVTLETCTTTYRTTLRTLISRPSHLSRYLTSLLLPVSETASICSNASDASLVQHGNGFSSVFHDHLASSGCLPQSSNAIHVFLDRPSAPYVHILAYLRSLPSTPEQAETLPRAVQLGPKSPAHLESLLELCDEASYLGLEALYELCSHEISRVNRASSSTCVGGSGTPSADSSFFRGKTGSVRSFRTVVDQSQLHREPQLSELRASKGSAGNARVIVAKPADTRSSSPGSLSESKDMRSRERKGLKYEVGSPPPGWI